GLGRAAARRPVRGPAALGAPVAPAGGGAAGTQRGAFRRVARRAVLARPRAGRARDDRSARDRPRLPRMGRGQEAEPVGPLTRVAAAAAVLAAGAVAGVLVLGRDARAPAVPTSAPLTVRAPITPPISGFRHPLVARLAVPVAP